MTRSDPLSRLERGLAEEERLARATVQWSQSWQDFTMDGELRDDENAGTIAMCLADQDRAHIARQDPKATLRRVEAIRKVLDLILDMDADIADQIVETLAGVYPEECP